MGVRCVLVVDTAGARANLLFVRAEFKLYLGGVVAFPGGFTAMPEWDLIQHPCRELPLLSGVDCRGASTESAAA